MCQTDFTKTISWSPFSGSRVISHVLTEVQTWGVNLMVTTQACKYS